MKDKNQNTQDHGRIPPQATDMEEAVLGSCLLENTALETVIDVLTGEMFYKEAHQKIYDAILSLHNQNDPVDILTITQQLQKKGTLEIVGGAYYVSSLTNRIATTANVAVHARIVVEKYMQRKLIEVCNKAVRDAYEDGNDVFDLITSTETHLNNIIEARTRKDSIRMDQLMRQFYDDLEEKTEKRKQGIEIGIPSGMMNIDRVTGGFHPGDLTIIAARPGMGKTALALSIARNVGVAFKRPVAIFSLEVTSQQNVSRLVAMESHIELHRIRDAKLDPVDFQKISQLNDLINSNIFIDDTPGISMLELRAKCRRLRSKEKIQLIIVDYLQLMRGEQNRNGNREQEISSISRGLKSLAKELEVPVIALSQLSRALESRAGDKRPMLSDLRESGAIEQDSDNVVFLYRPDYYKIFEDEEGNDLRGKVEYIISKHRHGELATALLKFTPVYTEFENDDQFVDEPTGILTPNDPF